MLRAPLLLLPRDCPPHGRPWAAAFWALSAAGALTAFLPGPRFALLRAAVLRSAARGKLWGRHVAPPPGARGLAAVPQRWFWHFYLLGSVWAAALLLLLMSADAPTGQVAPPPGRALLLGLMLLHCLRRLYEAGCCSIYAPQARMHVVGYLYGLMYYTVAPLSLWLHGCSGAVPGGGAPGRGGPWWGRLLWWHFAGAAVFLWGSFHQWRCHAILLALRAGGAAAEEPAGGPPPTAGARYGVPRGDWFEHVTSAHYLAEIVLYAGLVVASGGRDTVLWLLFAWVVANLTVAAQQSHAWYLEKFEDYPRARRVLLPFIY